MNKLVWMGIAAVAAVLLFMVWMYSTFIDPPPTAAVVKPPFNAFAYEVNYTLVFTISFSGVTVTTEGWFVVGGGAFWQLQLRHVHFFAAPRHFYV